MRGHVSANVGDSEPHERVRGGAGESEPAEFVGEHAIEAAAVTLLVREVLEGAFGGVDQLSRLPLIKLLTCARKHAYLYSTTCLLVCWVGFGVLGSFIYQF